MAIVSVANMVVWLITPIASKSFQDRSLGCIYFETSLNLKGFFVKNKF